MQNQLPARIDIRGEIRLPREILFILSLEAEGSFSTCKQFFVHVEVVSVESFSFVNKGSFKFLLNISVSWLDELPVDIDMAAIAIMESLGVVSFLMAFLFFRQRQRIIDKQRALLDALERQVISERGDGKCYSFEWVMDNIVYKPRKLLNVTPLLFTIMVFLLAVFFFGIGPYLFANLLRLGYGTVIALMGIAILLWTDAFQAYSYTNAIQKVGMEQIDKEDQSYMELAREALEKSFLRFVSVGVAFALFGPFIPQIFNGVVYVFSLYTTVFFQASEASFEVSMVLGALVILILPGLMLFLPEFLGRIMIRKGKSLMRKLFKRGVE